MTNMITGTHDIRMQPPETKGFIIACVPINMRLFERVEGLISQSYHEQGPKSLLHSNIYDKNLLSFRM